MGPEPTTEEKQDKITNLAVEFNIPESTAEACLIAASWDEDGARRVARLNRVEYLLVNIRFLGKNPIPHGGLLSLLFYRDSPRPIHFIGLVLDGYDYFEQVSPYHPPHDFIKAIANPNKLPKDEMPWFRVRDSVLLSLEPALIQSLFTFSGEKTTELRKDGRVVEHDPLKDTLMKTIKPAIDNIYMESIHFELSTSFLNGFQYDNLIGQFNKEAQKAEETAEPGKPPRPIEEVFKVYLKGQFVIDPNRGIAVKDLGTGDTVICDIIDPQPIAIQVGKMLGIYRRGVWFPAKGRIVGIEDSQSGTKRISIRVGHGIYIVARAINSVRIKVSENELDSIMRRIEFQHDEAIRSAASVLPVVLLILGMALALTILLHRG